MNTKDLRKMSAFFFTLYLCGSVLTGCPAISEDAVKSNAEFDARKYADEFYPSWQSRRVSCQGVDFDNNGYVSCTVGGEQTNNAGVVLSRTASIECAAAWIFDYGRGCRAARMVQQQQNGTAD